jgi:hypothetical protein
MPRRTIILVFIVAGICIFIPGCNSTKQPDDRVLATAANVADLGNILQFSSKTHVFRLINRADKTIQVTNLVNGCGCTRSKLNNNLVAPGQSTDITVTLFSDGREGRFASTVTVYWKIAASDRERKIDLVVQAKSVSIALVQPRSVDFSFIEPDDKARITSLWVGHGSAGVNWDTVVAWDSSGSLPIKTSDHRTFQIPIIFDPADRPIGTYRDVINIKLEDHGKDVGKPLLVPVTAAITSDVEIIPGSIYLGLMSPNSSKQGTFQIRSKIGQPVDLLSFRASDQSGFQITLKQDASTKMNFNTDETTISYDIKSPRFSGNASFKMWIKVRSHNDIYDLMIPVIVYQS